MGFGQGALFLRDGMRLWRDRPRLMLLGLIPAVIVAFLVAGALLALILKADDLIGWATPFADDWNDTLQDLFRAVLYVLVIVGAGLLGVVTFTGLTLAVGDPFYEKIWQEVELSLGGDVPAHGVGWIRGALDGLVLVLTGIATAVVVLLIGLLPLVGAVAGAVIGLIVAGRVLAAELVSRPLEARGMDRATRKELMAEHRSAMLGFGVCVQACFFVPFGGIMVMPAAVAGATYFARAALDKAAAGDVVVVVPPAT